MHLRILALFLIIVFCRCRPAYIPVTHNTPLLKKKNDSRLSVTTKDIQAAFAITDNVGVIAGYTNSNILVENAESISQRVIEIGFGHYKKINENQIFELYGGVGLGNYEFDLDFENYYFANTSRIFLQSNFGFTDDHFEAIISSRLFLYKFYNQDLSRYQGSYGISPDLSDIHNFNFLYYEPSLTVRFGWKDIKFFTQVLKPIKLNVDQKFLQSSFVSGNIGVSMNVSEIFKKTEKTQIDY